MSLIGNPDTPTSYVADYMQACVGMFGIPAGGFTDTLEAYGAATDWNVESLYAAMLNSSIGRSIFAPGVSNTTFATTLVGKLGGSLLADATEAAAIDVLKSLLDGGMSQAAVAMAAVEYVAALDTTDADFGAVAQQFQNRVTIANYYTFSSTTPSSTLSTLTAVLSGVTSTTDVSDPGVYLETVTDPGVTTGQTYTLTSGVDTLLGSTGNDTFIADNSNTAVTSVADSVTGGAGTDTLKIYSKAATANTLPTMSSIENLYIQGDNQGIDVSAVTGLTALELDAYTAAGKTYTVNNQAVTLSNLATGVATTIAGNSSTAQALTLSKFGTTASAVVDLSGTKVAAVTLTSTGAVGTGSNQVTLTDTGVKAATITINGDAALTATIGGGAAAGFVSTGITSIDASAATAATTLSMAVGTGGATHSNLATTFAYKGGTANDSFDVSLAGVAGGAITAAQMNAMTFNGGTGTDTLIVTNAIATGTTALTSLTAIENIGVLNGNGTINMANFSGVTGVTLTGTAAGGITVNNLGSAGTLAQGTSIDGANALTVNATGTTTADTLTWTVGSATAALGANTGAVTINGYETITLTSQGAANTLGAGGITLAASAGGNEALSIVATKDLTLAGAVTLSGASTSVGISGAGAVVVSGVLTSGSVTNTGTGAFTATGANKVLNFDASANTAAVSFTNSAATSAAIMKGGDGGVTFVASGFNDVITVGSGTNAITGGAGADVITINHGTVSKVTTLTMATPASDSGDATGFAASTAVPTAAFSTTSMDVITGFKAGDKIQLTGLTTAGTLLTNGSTTGAATAGDAILVKGTYSSANNTFTASTSGTDSAFVYDSNGTAAAGTYQAVILVGYTDTGTADTMSAGGLLTTVA